MSAHIVAREDWTSSIFSGLRVTIHADDEQEAEDFARPLGLVADVCAIGPGRFAVLVIDDD